MLEVTVSPSNPVFMLVMKRVGKALRSFVLDRTIAENTKDTGTARAHTHTQGSATATVKAGHVSRTRTDSVIRPAAHTHKHV